MVTGREMNLLLGGYCNKTEEGHGIVRAAGGVAPKVPGFDIGRLANSICLQIYALPPRVCGNRNRNAYVM